MATEVFKTTKPCKGKNTKNKNSLWQQIVANREIYFMIAPFFVLFTLFTIIPVVISLPVGFTDFNMVSFPKWVGLDNFFQLFLQDDIFIKAVKNTLTLSIVTGPLSYILCLLLAWMISQFNRTLRTILTFVFYIPSISGTTVFLVFALIFSGDAYGYINSFLLNFGVISSPIKWLTDARYTLLVVIIVQLWISLGSGFLSFIAGLQSIDRSQYEAGAVEGIRNRWQELWYITLPLLGPQLMFGAVMQITATFMAGYVTTALMGNPSVDYSAHTIINHAMDYGTIRYEMGYSAAICFIIYLTIFLINMLIRKLLRKYTSV